MSARAGALVGLVVLLATVPAAAQPGSAGWSLAGSNTLRIEHYDNGGDPSAPFYPAEGGQVFDELYLDFSRRVSPYERIHGQALGLINQSEFRSAEEDVVLERAGITWERGDGALPFRASAGDYFGYLSLRTLQRPLKGAQIELQPASTGRARQSLLLFTGTDDVDYRDLDPDADLYSGASWLLSDPALGAIGLNFVHNLREADPLAALPRRDQTVTSLVGEARHLALGQRLTLEGELAWFRGDAPAAGGFREDRSELGYMLQLRGRNRSPLGYRLRYERYGEHYRPNGAVVPADRESWEAHGSWRFASGLALRGRAQHFRDGLESINPLDTDTLGLSLGGPLASVASGALDAFVQSRELRDGTVDVRTRSVNLDLAAALAGGWTGRLGAFWQSVDDDPAGTGALTRQLTLGADRAFRLAAWRGVVSPGVVVRAIGGANVASDEFGPSLAVSLARRRHALSMDASALRQDRATGDDLLNLSAALRYTYTLRNHQLGVELDYLGRDADAAETVHGTRIGVFYSYSFDRAAPVGPPARAAAIAGGPARDAPGSEFELLDLAPGMPLEEARAAVRRAGLGDGVAGPRHRVYEARVLDTVDQRQRLVLEGVDGRLVGAALIIDFDDVGDTATAARTFERIRSLLIDAHGRPDTTYERGELTGDLVADVRAERTVRIDEWSMPAGRLRFGIPRRLDGRVRMELHHARRFPSPRETAWSVEAVR